MQAVKLTLMICNSEGIQITISQGEETHGTESRTVAGIGLPVVTFQRARGQNFSWQPCVTIPMESCQPGKRTQASVLLGPQCYWGLSVIGAKSHRLG